MSIDIKCYTKLEIEELQKKIDALIIKNPSFLCGPDFEVWTDYIFYPAKGLGMFGKEISNEYGLDPTSSFYILKNNKESEINTGYIAEILREEIGKENIIVLENGDVLI